MSVHLRPAIAYAWVTYNFVFYNRTKHIFYNIIWRNEGKRWDGSWKLRGKRPHEYTGSASHLVITTTTNPWNLLHTRDVAFNIVWERWCCWWSSYKTDNVLFPTSSLKCSTVLIPTPLIQILLATISFIWCMYILPKRIKSNFYTIKRSTAERHEQNKVV